MSWNLPNKAVVAGIECDQIFHPIPCCRRKLPCKLKLARSCRRHPVLVSIELVKADIENNDASGRQQFPRQVTGQRVVIPFHLQQSVPSFHDTARPASLESPARNWRREVFSWSMQELAGEANDTSSRRARPIESMGNWDLCFLCEIWSGCMAAF
ncbi:hypothetical protein EJB05_25245, partial [Eragrostis curvula]